MAWSRIARSADALKIKCTPAEAALRL